MVQNGFGLSGIQNADLGRFAPSFRNAILKGARDRLFLNSLDGPRGGSYRFRVDARKANSFVRVDAPFVRAADVQMDSVRSTPGAIIAFAVKVPPGSNLNLTLAQSGEEAMLDVAATNDRIAIRLRLPDGTVVTRENAQANGLEWLQARIPGDDSGGDPLGAIFAAAAMSAMMLPEDGTH
jgi:hypothetical protein